MCRAWQFLTVPKRAKNAVHIVSSKRAKRVENITFLTVEFFGVFFRFFPHMSVFVGGRGKF